MSVMSEKDLERKEKLRQVKIFIIHIIAELILTITLITILRLNNKIKEQREYIERIKRENIELEQMIYEYEDTKEE